MDLQWLDDVLVLLEEGNMTRAAARRNITQPAFSRRIRGFEDWLGTDILNRRANSVEISPALSANEPEIRALLSRLRDLRGSISAFDPASSTMSVAAQHAPVFSAFSEMVLHARRRYPAVRFRLRPGNLSDCVSTFLRGDSDLLLCYESDVSRPMPFGDTIRREVWGEDILLPLVGGPLRYALRDDGTVSPDTPAIIYPEASYFGQVLQASERAFSTRSLTRNPVCETALSSGVKELVLQGVGVGWLPFSMAFREIESGQMISLAGRFGQEHVQTALYGHTSDEMACALLDVWSVGRRKQG